MKNNPALKINQIVEVTIDRLSFGGGRGVGRFNDIVMFVPFTLPKEVVTAKVIKFKKNFAECELVRVLTPSPHRVNPLCEYFQVCGGCAWQHIEYENQVEIKSTLLKDLLVRSIDFKGEYLGVVPAPQPYNYRNRVQIHHSKGRFGFHKRQSSEIVDIKECKIAEAPINTFIASPEAAKLEGRVELLLDSKLQVVARTKTHQFDTPYFAQVNRWQNDNLKLRLENWLQDLAPSYILDLYCGNGNLTQVLFKNFPDKPIVGVDFSEMAVSEATQEVKKPNVSFVESDVDRFLMTLNSLSENSLVVLDPPRTGLSQKGAEKIRDLTPKHIIYVSCNPSTLVRDLKFILKNEGYKVERVLGLDMFPQTDHLETMTLIHRL